MGFGPPYRIFHRTPSGLVGSGRPRCHWGGSSTFLGPIESVQRARLSTGDSGIQRRWRRKTGEGEAGKGRRGAGTRPPVGGRTKTREWTRRLANFVQRGCPGPPCRTHSAQLQSSKRTNKPVGSTPTRSVLTWYAACSIDDTTMCRPPNTCGPEDTLHREARARPCG